MKATGTNDLLLRECAEDTRNNFKSWVFIILFETVVFGDFLTVSKSQQQLGQEKNDLPVLGQVEFSGDFFFSTKLHNQILIPRLALSDGCIETELRFHERYSNQVQTVGETDNEQDTLIILWQEKKL